jgi:hypothetical protein
MTDSSDPVAGMTSPLHLRFFATGGNQHVFEETSGAFGEWVFKVPSAFGFVVPWDHPRRLRRKPPRNPVWRVLYRWLFAPTPSEQAAVADPAARRWSPTRPLEQAWAQYIRWSSTRRFNRMVRLMGDISAMGGSDLLLAYRVLEQRPVVLEVSDREIRYEDPVVMQQRARFRKMHEIIDEGDWESLVEAQYRLWRLGFAVADVIRHTSWVMQDGQPQLADADSLTDDLSKARVHVSDWVHADEAEMVMRALKGVPTRRSPDEFLDFMRRHINVEALERHWGADRQGDSTVARSLEQSSPRGEAGDD